MFKEQQPVSPFQSMLDEFFTSLQAQGLKVDADSRQLLYEICFGQSRWSHGRSTQLSGWFTEMLTPVKDEGAIIVAVEALGEGIVSQFSWGQRQHWPESHRYGSLVVGGVLRQLYQDLFYSE